MKYSVKHDRTNPIIEKLRAQRELKGLTQGQIAAKLDVSQNAYSKVELGQTKITLNALFAIADILDIQVAELFD
ncbi:helix-turn-helix domain-containing protein [Mucilaginibacter sp.]